MLRAFQTLIVGLVLVVAGQRAAGFSLLVPSPASGAANPALNWQDPAFNIGYNMLNSDIGGPGNLGEEFRWNLPVITYAFDESFLNYFGAKGEQAVEAAIAILNDLPAVSQFSPTLSEFPLDVTRVNFRAQALDLADLKSSALALLVEELGLTDPERYAWTLRERRLITVNNVTTTNYFVIQRNFDPVTLAPTPYVNGILFTYKIREFSPPAAAATWAEAFTERADKPGSAGTSITGRFSQTGIGSGTFFTGVDRDTAGGFRYLYRTNNVNVERLITDNEVAVTNIGTLTLLTTTDLATFIEDTQNTTNTPAQVRALYPGLNLTGTNAYLTNSVVTNIITYFTNFPADPSAVFITNVVIIPDVTNFLYSFDNVVTNSLYSDNTVIDRTIDVSLSPNFTPGLGTLLTNVFTNSVISSNFLNGEIYIRPTNLLDFQIVSTQLVSTASRTNIISSAFGNLFSFTNATTNVLLMTRDLGLFSEQSVGGLLDPNAMRALYPGLLITSTNQRLTNLVLTNYVGSDVVLSNAIVPVYDYTYGNVVTNVATRNLAVTNPLVQVTNIAPAGAPVYVTNTTTDPILTSGGSATTRAGALITPLGNHNDMQFVAATNGTALNDVRILFLDDGSISSNAATASFSSLTKQLTIRVRTNVTDVNTALLAVNRLGLPHVVTSGGSTSAKASAPVILFGANNDLLLEAKTTNVVTTTIVTNEVVEFIDDQVIVTTNFFTNTITADFNGVGVRFIDDGLVTGNAAVATYNVADRLLTVNINKGATTAATVTSEVATSVAAGMAAFQADFSLVANLVTEPGNSGTGTLGIPLFIASLCTTTAPDTIGLQVNDGTGLITANMGTAVLISNFTTVRLQTVEVIPNPNVEPGTSNLFITNLVSSTLVNTNLVSGEFYIVPTNLLGYQILGTLRTDITEATNLVVTNATAKFTNAAVQLTVQTIDLTRFSQFASTNSPAQILASFAAAFPGQPLPLITSSTVYFTNLVTPVITAFLTNYPTDPAMVAPTLIVQTNFTTNVVQRFTHTFGNVRTNSISLSARVGLQLTEFTKDPFAPAMATNLITKVTTSLITSNFVNGTVYIVPTNLFDFSIISTQLVNITTNLTNIFMAAGTNFGNLVTNTLDLLQFSTNFIYTANAIQFLNPTNVGVVGPGIRQELIRSVTNTLFEAREIQLLPIPGTVGGGVGQQNELITFSTNRTLAVNPIVFQQQASNATPQLRRGIDKIQFQRVNFDSLLGQGFESVTNVFSSVVVSNNTNSTQLVRRISTRPDILFTAEDLGLQSNLGGPIPARRTTTTGWINGNGINGNAALGGPGVIPPGIVITFNKVGPMQVNRTPFFLEQEDPFFTYFVWGSFDGSTNAPVVYPTGTTISDLENQLLAPSINGQPQGQTVNAGGAVALTVGVVGEPPLTFIWRRDNVVIPGDGATLFLNNVSLLDAGDYTVTISNGFGTVTSQPATLTVQP